MPLFHAGERIRVLDLGKAGHVRIPAYVRGHVGTVVQFCGVFLNPEDLAIGNAGGRVVGCYRVEFLQTDLWTDYSEYPDDTLVTEIYEHWMEPAHG
ncbi:SH3-like domain-containing protein [Methylorubrum rhodesianum]|uniref:SH3-like domain-containing protein n=1 Tax=Methylorubrum TaxID=2282523 RepID=UPI00160F6698|nr:SH3-like domain-containing protein [Methylorubrum rhodesianum]MBB5765602.1 nitrile hydratase [Methylorubrum rhodesianum]MBI1692229.1 nitrile hydratase subunit beta [Methylorubrum sp. DB1722]